MDIITTDSDLSDLLQSEYGCEYTDIEDGVINCIGNSKGVNLNILHLNIRSFNKNNDSLTLLLNDLQDRGIIVHLIGMCESFLTDTMKAMANLENYTAFHKCRVNKSGGGVSLFVHDSVTLIGPISSPFNDNFESIMLEVMYKGKRIQISEFNRPPNCPQSILDSGLQEIVRLSDKYDLSVLCTDQNLDLLKTHLYKPSRDFLSFMLDNEFVPYIMKPTRVTHCSSTLIDNIYIRRKNKVLMKNYSYILIDGMSDHFPCFVSYELYRSKPYENYITMEKRKLDDVNVARIQQDLLFHDWSDVDSLNVNDGYSYLNKVVTDMMDKHAPKKLVKVKIDDKFYEPWMTVGIKRSNRKCRLLCNKARCSGLMSDQQLYKDYRNALNRIKLHEKRVHYESVFQKIGKNSKLLWNVIHGVLKKANNKHHIGELLYKNKVLTDKQEIGNAFSEHFVSVGQRLQNSLADNAYVAESDGCKNVKKVNVKMRFKRVSEGELCKIVSNLKPKNSSGIDGVSNNLLKKLIAIIKKPLCVIVNKSLTSGVFPDLLKLAKVILLHKSGLTT